MRPPLTTEQRDRRNARRRELYVAQGAEWHAAERERKRLSAQRRRKENPEMFAAASHRWWSSRGRYDEEIRERKKAYLAERNTEYCRRRRAQRCGAESEAFTAQVILEVWGTDCHICGSSIDLSAPRRSGAPGWERGLHLDHVIPLSRGGGDTVENVKPAHGRCNLMKSSSSSMP